MGTIFPMASLKVRQGSVRKREKAARRAEEQRKSPSAIPPVDPARVLEIASNSTEEEKR